MQDLIKNACTPCRTGDVPASAAEINEWLLQIPDWQIVTCDAVPRLSRSFKFETFRQALAFTNRIGELAEAEQHHPELLTAWGEVRASWWTHKIAGLHRNDFIMAARTDRLFVGCCRE